MQKDQGAAGKKSDRASPTKKTPPSRSGGLAGNTSATHLTEGRLGTPGPADMDGMSPLPDAVPRGDNPDQERKYRDKLSAQVSWAYRETR